MDENIKTLLTWDNILLAISAVGVTSGVCFFFWTSFKNNSSGKLSEPQTDLLKEKVKLEDLSRNWIDPKRQKKEKVYLKDLRHLWRKIDDKEVPDDDNTVVHTFKNDRVRKFFHKYIHEKSYFKNARRQRSVVIQVLHMLDNEGDCPSVVFLTGDPEKEELTTGTYAILSRVSLLNHSLNVAEIICQLIKKDSPQGAMLMAPDALVCALGHDLGKLPRFCADGYTHGSHPLTSGTILQDVNDFKLLKNREEIESAIKRHHHPNIDKEKSPLLRLLVASDKKARIVEEDVVIGLDKERFEHLRYTYKDQEKIQTPAPRPKPIVKTISENLPSPPEENQIEPLQEPAIFEEADTASGDQEPTPAPEDIVNTEDEDIFYDAPIQPQNTQNETRKKSARPKKPKPPVVPDQTPSPEKIAQGKAAVTAAWKEEEFLHGISDPSIAIQTEKAKTVTLDGWFSPSLFLSDLEKMVNQTSGMQIPAFSMPNGKIYVAPDGMKELIQKQAREAKIEWVTELDTYVDLAELNKNPVWSTMLIGIVDIFRAQGFVDSCIRPGFYGNRFVLMTEPIVTPGTRFYTVFLANAFKTTISQFESKKITARLRNIKDVVLAKK